jgi:tRNA threonylcarbamoyladenosine biosynthesis protein TsaB
MRILAIDTATMISSVAVAEQRDGNVVALAERDSSVGTHSDSLVTLIDEALTEAGLTLNDLDAIAVGAGPGSFTGLRIGMATGKGIAFAEDKPLWAVSSLAALASGYAAGLDAGADPLIVAVMDAKRQEIFAGCFRVSGGGVVRGTSEERVLAPGDLGELVANPDNRPVVVIGDAIDLYGEALAAVGTLTPDARPTPPAMGVARMALGGERVDGLTSATPVYIRPSEAEIKFPNGNPGGTFARPDK